MYCTKNFNSYIKNKKNDHFFKNIWDELKWRNLIAVSTDENNLKSLINTENTTFYCGFDPTASSLHLGHLIQLLFIKRLQLANHRPIILIGEATSQVGDPTFTKERSRYSYKKIKTWSKNLRNQILSFLNSHNEEIPLILNNIDWIKKINLLDFLNDIGRNFKINNMLKKEVIKSRLNSSYGISYNEFSYQILQSIDFLYLYKKYKCLLQIGGLDQWGNITSGINFIRKVKNIIVHGIGLPLIKNSLGIKLGKSNKNGVIWIDQQLTSPHEIYQFFINLRDNDVISYLKMLTFKTKDEIDYLESKIKFQPNKRYAHHVLGYEVISLLYGIKLASTIQSISKLLYDTNSNLEINESLYDYIKTNMPNIVHKISSLDMNINNLLLKCQLCKTQSQAMRLINQHGIYVNNQQISSSFRLKTKHFISNHYLLLRKGKKQLALVFLN